MKTKKYYITTPIYYVNDIPHLGHAYTSMAVDIISRFKKLNNFEVFFSTGTDEHGQKVENSAIEKKIAPKDFTDSVSKRFFELTEKLKLVNNNFIRTTDARHKKEVLNIWDTLIKNKEIYLGEYEGWYSVRDESFINENDILTDKKNNKIGPSKDILKKIKEPSYFFKLSKWQKPLLDFYDKNKNFVKPTSRLNEVKRFVEGGLEDLSISRTSFNWGIKVPNNPKHVIYVWLDALFNYISTLGGIKSDNFNKFWPPNSHIVGKDILRFHAVYWPAFLMASGLKPPKNIFAHGWWTINGEKMSKSLGNVIDPNYLIDTYGLDQIKYFLFREIPFGEDGNFSEELLVSRINSDLANDYGNLVQRVLSMLHKYNEGIVPKANKLNENDQLLLKLPEETIKEINVLMTNFELNNVLEKIWKIIKKANSYVDINQPWNLYKENNIHRLNTVLNILLNTVYKIAILNQPFLPTSSKNILDLLNIKNEISYNFINKNLKVGLSLKQPKVIFPRIIR
ncbi:MAG: methionine--tRNA ligase [Rickettsiales bacterium TMED254]|nr:methionine--tRNA ligase [Rickettsiales bacterium]RPF77768.1 MAG: methionine--tRNA ligase [Rickettsiales bacterium TMED254]